MFRYQKFITRDDLRKNPDTTYVFGDNMLRVGLGGQAKEMRGEMNALGIPTKKKPSWDDDSFFTDDDLFDVAGSVLHTILSDLESVFDVLDVHNRDVVWPEDGIGTGLANLEKSSPLLWRLIESYRKYFEENFGENTKTTSQLHG
jgi:hypothetical protein